MKKTFFAICFFAVLNSFSQAGKDGIKNVSGSTILNSYSPLVSNATAGSMSVTVLSQQILLNLCPGDLVMIY